MVVRAAGVVMIAVLMSAGVQADYLVGARLGVMSVGFDEVESDDDPINAGFLFGYERLQGPGLLGFELEITRSISPGEVVGQDLEVDSQGIYVSYASTGTIYVKGRLGLMDASLSAGPELTEDEGGETYGLALGYRLPDFRVELDYTSIDDDVAFINAGVVYSF